MTRLPGNLSNFSAGDALLGLEGSHPSKFLAVILELVVRVSELIAGCERE